MTRAQTNGDHVTRAELGAHLLRFDEHLRSMDGRLARIENRLDARPAQRWLAGRATRIFDSVLPMGVVFALGWAASNLL